MFVSLNIVNNMNKISSAKCEICLRRGLDSNARTICNECREFLCEECSDTHLLQKSSMNHCLINLDQPGEEASTADECELALDLENNLSVTESTVRYRAQVAVECEARSKDVKKDTEIRTEKAKKDEVEIEKFNVKNVHEFRVSKSDDKKDFEVRGILILRDKIVIAESCYKKLKLFDLSGNFRSSTDMKEYTWGIAHINNDRFATCGYGNKVFLWTVREQTIVSEDESYDVDHIAHGIHYNGTYYGILHSCDVAVTVLDRQGKGVRKIVMKEAFGKNLQFGWDIHIDRDKHDIYVPCIFDNNGVVCMSVEGEALWFTTLSNASLQGITEIHGALCIADSKRQCLHLISKSGQYREKLPTEGELNGIHEYIHYDERDHKLYVSHDCSTDKGHIVSVYSL